MLTFVPSLAKIERESRHQRSLISAPCTLITSSVNVVKLNLFLGHVHQFSVTYIIDVRYHLVNPKAVADCSDSDIDHNNEQEVVNDASKVLALLCKYCEARWLKGDTMSRCLITYTSLSLLIPCGSAPVTRGV